MSVPDNEFVASGCAYTVPEVAGRVPMSLDDFVGDVHFIVVREDQRCDVSGSGSRNGSAVRFHEKQGGTGRDLRVWQVTSSEGNAFEATAISNY